MESTIYLYNEGAEEISLLDISYSGQLLISKVNSEIWFLLGPNSLLYTFYQFQMVKSYYRLYRFYSSIRFPVFSLPFTSFQKFWNNFESSSIDNSLFLLFVSPSLYIIFIFDFFINPLTWLTRFAFDFFSFLFHCFLFLLPIVRVSYFF